MSVYSLNGSLYDFLDGGYEKKRYASIRQKILKPLTGKVLDAGCGTGRNFPYFSSKCNVLAIDNSEKMLSQAKKRVAKSGADITIKKMNLKNIDIKTNYFDTIVSTFVLCVMKEKDRIKALKEFVRVAKPGAKLYFLEYVYSNNKFRKVVMVLTAFIPRLLYGLHFNSTLKIVKENKNLKLKEVQYVYKDVVQLIIAQKLEVIS